MTFTVVIVVLLVLAVGAVSALASGPVWAITSASAPTNLTAAIDEVQVVEVSASGGSFALAFEGQETAAIPYNAPAAMVQADLDGLSSIGGVGGGVVVTGGPGGAGVVDPYVVTFTRGLGGRQVSELVANGGSLTGGAPRAAVMVRTRGAVSGEYVLTAVNVGDGLSSGAVTVTDALPAGLAVTGISGEDLGSGGAGVCTVSQSLGCSFAGTVAPGDVLRVAIGVDVLPGAPASVFNSASVSGGGAAEGASASNVSMVGGPLAPFGVSSFLTAVSGPQAAGHPNLMTSFTLNQVTLNGEEALEDEPSAAVKDVELDLPPGVVGNPTAVPTCTANGVQRGLCPSDTAVGVVFASLSFTPPGKASSYSGLVYNVVPYPSEPAAFMFQVASYTVRLDTSLVIVDGEYRVHVSVRDVNGVEPALSSTVTLWGVPADFNGPGGTDSADFGAQPFGGESRSAPKTPLLTNADDCAGGSLTSVLSADSWRAPGVFPPASKSTLLAPTGCGVLSFDPSLSVEPESLQAGLPIGYGVDLKIPQSESPEGLATPDLRDATVSLPPGVTLNPSAANGLEACTAAEIGIGNESQPSCPSGSDIGTVKVTTPLLANPLEGQLYIGQPSNQGASESIPLYLVVEGSGVLIKIPGTTTTDPSTGQITATFKDNPQLPFSDLHIQIKGGPRAPLVNPEQCGPATTTSDLTPWSSPATPDAAPLSAFNVSFDGNDAPCPGTLPFAPSFTAGDTATAQANAFSPFSVTVSRQDGQQTLSQIDVTTPPGLLGMLSRVPLCGEPQASQGTCPAASLIGHTTTAAGVGPDPFWLGGQVFLTGPYKGAPFGLSIVVPAVAGPFNLGTVIVRAQVRVDPNTGQVTVVSDPLPQMLQGIPLQIRTVNVNIDRPGFMFNPTNCNPLTSNATITSAQGASTALSSPFQANNCANLPFKPSFTASTQAKTSKANGASLHVKLVPPHEGPQTSGASGSSGSSGSGSGGVEEANIARVKVDLPKILPSRLTTLQKACTSATFDANPANCPAASVVGSAVAHTPLLANPVRGPAYFVSHGNEAFPQLVVVLQGEGITVDLVGDTFISKAGITSSTFAHVPDVPVSSFELVLPEGKYSALAANADLCKNSKKLTMPTEFVGQNGAKINESTKISVTGCPKAKKAKHKAKKHKKTRKG